MVHNKVDGSEYQAIYAVVTPTCDELSSSIADNHGRCRLSRLEAVSWVVLTNVIDNVMTSLVFSSQGRLTIVTVPVSLTRRTRRIIVDLATLLRRVTFM